jgi:ketosteroid isomerase-like protein
MMDRAFAERFAIDWVDSWNSHDLERILAHYTDDFVMSSPMIVQRLQEPSGTLQGKDAIRRYWSMGLNATPALRFELERVLVGMDSLTIEYRRAFTGSSAAEVLFFDQQLRVVRGVAHYE